MPSGFQQDSNQLQPNFYRVAIDTSSATYYPTTDGDTNGGITPNGWDALATKPTTAINAVSKADQMPKTIPKICSIKSSVL